MARCFLPPENIVKPEYDSSVGVDENIKREEEFVEAVVDYCKANSKCPDAGTIVRFPIADGYAQYVVFQYSVLIHLLVGDAWAIPDAHMRGLLSADIKAMIKLDRDWEKMLERARS